MILNFILLIAGFALVAVSADKLVDGASAIARRLNVSDLVIGLTVVAFGTSMPEFIVNIVAALEGSSEIALTNIIGSNTINTFIVLGFSAAVFPLVAEKSSIRFDIPMSFFAAVLVLLMGSDFFDGIWESSGNSPFHGMSRVEGVILLMFFVWFLIRTFRVATKNSVASAETQAPSMKMWLAVLTVLISLVGLVVSGELIVRSATAIARFWGVSDAVIGVTVVALGTSLPELATSVVAAYKKNVDLAIGNVFGSNIFNVFFILGTSAAIHPLASYDHLMVDASMAALGSLLVLIFVSGKKHKMGRMPGWLLVAVYAVYLWWLIRNL